MPNFENLSKKQQELIQASITQQLYLEDEASVAYQCYYEKIDTHAFFQKYLWDWLWDKYGFEWEKIFVENE